MEDSKPESRVLGTGKIALQIGPQSVSCLDLDCWALGDLKIGLIIITVQRYKLIKSLRFFAKFQWYVKIFSSNRHW